MSNALSVSIFDLSIGDNDILRNTLDNPVSMAIDKMLLRFSKKIFRKFEKNSQFPRNFFLKNAMFY